jgi:uncharacterized protein
MTQKKGKANRLIHATSPYLQQHAFNPVDWYEWGDEALTKAKDDDKPILISIGYSSCHWCHVMERESFEVESIAALMNENFVCIKVDREERPDIDQVYMEAVQAMGGHGGWPLNVFLTPGQKPFYGGTYFPPANWSGLLRQIQQIFSEKRAQIEENAEQLSDHLSVSDLQRFGNKTEAGKIAASDLEQMFSILADRFDKTYGGMEKAPKFVMPTLWLFLLRYHKITGNSEALSMVSHTLFKMQQGGLYDQLGGGFARYSVDARWFAPHFEKMLYDNAQLISLYSEAYANTKNSVFKTIVYETINWLKREMTHPLGGFYSALDADSEGEEGKFYSWTSTELDEILGADAKSLNDYFSISTAGNWEHGRNILLQHDAVEAPTQLTLVKKKLLAVRNKRIHPALDDKILTGWNGLAIKGLTDAYDIFGEPMFLELAEQAIRFVEKNLMMDGKVFRSFRNKRTSTEGFLEDYAFLILAYTSLYQSTFKEAYLQEAERWTTYVVKNFLDEQDGYFHFSGNHAEKLIARKKEIFDNVIPGSNSVMARNLYQLGVMLDNGPWKQKAISMASQLSSIVYSEPGYMSNWGILLAEISKGLAEIVIVGPEMEAKRKELAANYTPFAVRMGAVTKSDLPLFEGRGSVDGQTKIYVCFDKACQLPVTNVNDALLQLIQSL